MLVILALIAAVFFLPSPWGVIAVAVALVADTGEIAFGLWYAKRRRPQTGAQTLVGQLATVVARLDPVGQVRVNGELWEARSPAPTEAGQKVRIEAVGDDLTLAVRPVSA